MPNNGPEADPPTCSHFGCGAARLGANKCLAHTDDSELQQAIERWRTGEALEAHGRIGSAELQRLFEALDRIDIGVSQARSAGVRPRGCGAMHFQDAQFEGDVSFRELIFPGPVLFDGAKFEANVDFGLATFTDHADFDNVVFKGEANFRGATFRDHAGFERAEFKLAARFTAATFESAVDFNRAVFYASANIDGAQFLCTRQLGQFTVKDLLNLEASEFVQRVTLDIEASEINARRIVFADGARVSLRGGRLDLEGADLGRAPTIAGGREGPAPKLLNLSGAQVAGLSLSGVNLENCCFFRAHGLETLNVEANCKWRRTLSKRRCIDREMLAEEFHWRCQREPQRRHQYYTRIVKGAPWSKDADGDETHQREHLGPEQLASLYRALRKAREESKDQAGAADLYYGEMEMRRRALAPSKRGRLRAWTEKGIIIGYWAVAGYGLRASRAFVAFASLVFLAAMVVDHGGFAKHVHATYWQAVWFAAKSTVSLVHVYEVRQSSPEAHLSTLGEIVGVTVRVTGPVLLGLAAFSLRSRIKR